MVKILICPDKFKGSLTAQQVCDAIEAGLVRSNSGLQIEKVPLADGGEGTFEFLIRHFHAKTVRVEVHDPLFRNIIAEYGLSQDGSTAFIEMAKASGLQLIDKEKRNPLYTTSLGTGELIADALMRNVNKIILGIGGSATNDAGIGMAHALGFRFLDAGNGELKPIGQNLSRLNRIGRTNVTRTLKETEFIVLSDVQNPLYGKSGAAYIYGPQKGANDIAVQQLDQGLKNFAAVAEKEFHVRADFPGAGAAGGLGGGAKIFLNAKIVPGINYIFGLTGIEEKIQNADIIITGEGKVDEQSFFGKVTGEVIALAARTGKRLLLCCGSSELEREQLIRKGVTEVLTLADKQVTETEAIIHAAELLTQKVAATRMIKK